MFIRINKQNIIVCLIALLCICLLSPAIQRTIGDLSIMALAGIILVLEINDLIRLDLETKNTYILIFIYVVMLFIYKVFGISTASVNMHLQTVTYFLPFLCIRPVFNKLDKKQMLFILICALGAMAVTLIQNYELKQTWKSIYSIRLYRTSNVKTVISTQYTCAILLVSGALFYLFLHTKSIAIKIGSGIGAVLCVLFNISVTQRGIILILSVIMFPLLLFYNVKQKSAKQYFWTALFVLLALLVIINYENVLMWIGEISGSNRLKERMSSIADLVSSNSLEDAGANSLTLRIKLTINSIHTFFSSLPNFLFGVGHRMGNNLQVGNHSQLFDEFARYGIFGGILSFSLMILMLKSTKTIADLENNSTSYAQFLVLCLIFLLRAGVGTIMDPSTGVAMFVIVPVIFYLNGKERA